MLRASSEAWSAGGPPCLPPRIFSLPQPPSTRRLILKADGGEPRLPPAAEKNDQMKASALCGAGWEHDSIEVLWQDAGRAFCRCWRDDVDGEKHAFIPVLSGAEHPTLEIINRLIREYQLKDYLDGAWALRAVELVREPGRTMLVVEYTAGEPLDRLIGQPLE